MSHSPLALGFTLFLAACAGRNTTPPESSAQTAAASASAEPAAASARAPQARQDRGPTQHRGNDAARSEDGAAESGEGLTAMDQSNDEIDLDLTRRIRKQIVADDQLSFSAKNVKVITRGGVVTLSGSVKNATEAAHIRDKALTEAGQGHVEDQLQIDP